MPTSKLFRNTFKLILICILDGQLWFQSISRPCILHFRYILSTSYSDLSDNLKADLQSKMLAAGASGSTDAVVLKFFLNSMEYTKIHNFPQHGLQFVAEVRMKTS